MSQLIEVKVPDIGDFTDVPVIEVLVKAGERVQAEDALLTLESEKATMEVPAPFAGLVKEMKVKAGDKVSQGSLIMLAERTTAGEASPSASAPAALPEANPAAAALGSSAEAPAGTGSALARSTTPQSATRPAPPPIPRAEPPARAPGPQTDQDEVSVPSIDAHASPSVRRFARELGVTIGEVAGSGPKGRITREDVQAHVKTALAAPRAVARASSAGLDLLPWPKVDFAKYGETETEPLSRVGKIAGANLARNWVMIPHVTQFDDADITDLEAFRVSLNKENEKAGGVKITMLAFLIKACVAALQKQPKFNASLDGENLLLKKYFNIGFAADTPNGLVVPVIKNAEQKGVLAIAAETADLAGKARGGKLAAADMQGGSFSISSLGGIGGTAFTPIINAPEVAILGVSRSITQPVWNGREFMPRLMLPLSLSYDHRVIDGAAAARFTSSLAATLADMRRVLL